MSYIVKEFTGLVFDSLAHDMTELFIYVFPHIKAIKQIFLHNFSLKFSFYRTINDFK